MQLCVIIASQFGISYLFCLTVIITNTFVGLIHPDVPHFLYIIRLDSNWTTALYKSFTDLLA